MTPLVELIRRYLAAEPYRRLPDDDLWAKFAGPRDEQALCALLERCGARIFARCRSVLRDEHLAEEAFQETFCELYRRRARLPSYRAAVAWLYQTATNQARKARRRHWRALRRDRARATATPEAVPARAGAEVVEREEVTAVLAALAGLPAKQRRALELVYQEGLTHDEAAAALGWSRGAVGVYVARGLERLRAVLSRRGLLTAAGGAVAVESALTARVPALTVERAATLAGGVLARTETGTARTLAGLALGRWKVAAVVGLAAGLAVAGAAWRPREPTPPAEQPAPMVIAPEPGPPETLQAKNLRILQAEVLPELLAIMRKHVPTGTEVRVAELRAEGSEVFAEFRPSRENAGLFPKRIRIGYCVLRREMRWECQDTVGGPWIGLDATGGLPVRLPLLIGPVQEIRVSGYHAELAATRQALERLPRDERAEAEHVDRWLGAGASSGRGFDLPVCEGVAGNSTDLYVKVPWEGSVFVRHRTGGWRYWGRSAGRALAANETHLYHLLDHVIWTHQVTKPNTAAVKVCETPNRLRVRFFTANNDYLFALTWEPLANKKVRARIWSRSLQRSGATWEEIGEGNYAGLAATSDYLFTCERVGENDGLLARPLGQPGATWGEDGAGIPAPDNAFLTVWGDRLIHVPDTPGATVARPVASREEWKEIGRVFDPGQR